MVRVDDHLGALFLQADGGVDDEALGAADAQVRVEEDVTAAHGLGHVLGQRLAEQPLCVFGLAPGVVLAEGLARRPFHGAHLALGLLLGKGVRSAAGLLLLPLRRLVLLHGRAGFVVGVDSCVSQKRLRAGGALNLAYQACKDGSMRVMLMGGDAMLRSVGWLVTACPLFFFGAA